MTRSHTWRLTALKDSPDDIKRLRHYFNHVVKDKKGDLWRALYEARDELPDNLQRSTRSCCARESRPNAGIMSSTT